MNIISLKIILEMFVIILNGFMEYNSHYFQYHAIIFVSWWNITLRDDLIMKGVHYCKT